MAQPNALIFFVRNPVPGKVKTRLARGVGELDACALYTCFIQDMLDMMEALPMEVLVFSWPPLESEQVQGWLGPDYSLHPQQGRDLGKNMQKAFEQVFALGYSRALLVGSDIPDLPANFLVEAMKALDTHDCVLGPSQDGGYYLVGFDREGFCPEIFSGPQWGTSSALDHTLEVLKSRQVSHQKLATWRDVDDLDDLQALHTRLEEKLTEARSTQTCIDNILAKRPALFSQE